METDHPLPNNEASRKREERLRVRRAGLKRIPIYLYPGEVTAFREKAVREGWSVALSSIARVEEAEGGLSQDLLARFVKPTRRSDSKSGNTVDQVRKSKVPNAQARRDDAVEDLPGQTFFWDTQSMVGGNRSAGTGENGVIVTLFNGSNQ